MDELRPNEDERGVDIGQIRRLLRMSESAANRPKDLRALPYLESLREQLGGR